jgi:amino acid transporter
MKKIARYSLAFLFCLLLLAPIFSLSASTSGTLAEDQEGLADIGRAFGENGEPRDVRLIAVQIINVVLTVLALIFVVLFIFGGFKWMTAAGNDDQIGKAKKTLVAAVIGLVIVIAAWGISRFIICKVLDASQGGYTCSAL